MPDEIPLPKKTEDFVLPREFIYVTWNGEPVTHIGEKPKQTPLCGVGLSETEIPFLTSKFMGKERCPACLKAAGIELPKPDNPINKEPPPEVARVPAETQDLPEGGEVMDIKAPPGFFENAKPFK